MNERIRELLGQAYDEAVPETWTTLSSEQLGRVYDKFAELIVSECIDRIKNADMTDLEGSDPDDVLWLVERQIVKHFGVKE